MALGGWLGGVLFDVFGSYHWALMASLLIGLVGLPLSLSLPRHPKTTP
jgi:predicted MFS family arabinose efflux permease